MQLLIAGNADVSDSGGIHANYPGQVKVIASLNATRLSDAPDKPTFAEAGYDLAMPSMLGFMAPAGLPDDIAATLEAALLRAGESEDFVTIVEERLKSKIAIVSAEDTAATITELDTKLRPLAKQQ